MYCIYLLTVPGPVSSKGACSAARSGWSLRSWLELDITVPVREVGKASRCRLHSVFVEPIFCITHGKDVPFPFLDPDWSCPVV